MSFQGLTVDPAAIGALLTALATLVGQWRARRELRDKARTIDSIRNEVRPNGGGSMRDVIDRIERTLCELTARIEQLETERAARRRRRF